MQIEFQCSCGTRMRTSAANLGKRTKCAKCGLQVRIAPATAGGTGLGSGGNQRSSSARVNSRPLVAATPVSQAQPAAAFVPLDLSDLSFPIIQTPAQTAWSAPGFQAAPKMRSTNLRPLWIGLGVGAFCLFCLIGLAAVFTVWKSYKSPVANSRASGSGSSMPSSPTAEIHEPQGAPVTRAEAEDVVRRFVVAVGARDFNLCKSLFDMDGILDGIADEAKMSSVERRGFMDGARKQPQLWDQVHPIMRAGGEYIVLRPVQRGGELRVIVRLSSEQTGLNYHEFILRRNEKQQVEIADVYILASGGTLREAMRRLVLNVMAGRDTSVLGRFSAAGQQAIKSGKTISKIACLSKSSPVLALQEFKTLPADLQKDKTMMIMKLGLCANISPEEYSSTFEEFQRLYPGDASIDLLSIDYFLNRNENNNAIAAARRLNDYVGGDTLLEKMIAGIQRQ